MNLWSQQDSLFKVMTEFPAGVNTTLLHYFLFLPLPSCSCSYLLLQLPLPVCQVAHPTHLLCNKSSSAALAGVERASWSSPPWMGSTAQTSSADASVKAGDMWIVVHEWHTLETAHPLILDYGIYLPLMFSYSVYLPLVFSLDSLQDFQEYHFMGTYLETNL